MTLLHVIKFWIHRLTYILYSQSGDVVRLYHQEGEGYITNLPGTEGHSSGLEFTAFLTYYFN